MNVGKAGISLSDPQKRKKFIAWNSISIDFILLADRKCGLFGDPGRFLRICVPILVLLSISDLMNSLI